MQELLQKAAAEQQKEILQTKERLDKQIRQLLEDHVELDRMEIAEKATEELRQSVGTLCEDLRGKANLVKDLASKCEEVEQRVEMSEAATSAVREELMSGALVGALPPPPVATVSPDKAAMTAGAGAPPSPSGLESRVRELQHHVAAELESLTVQQQELEGVPRRGQGQGGERLEAAVKLLREQVSEELLALQKQQEEVGSLRSRGEARRPGTGEAPDDKAVGAIQSKVDEISRQVARELQALAAQQTEIGATKVTLREVMDQVKESKAATEALRRQLAGGAGTRPGRAARAHDESDSYDGEAFDEDSA